MVTTVESGPFAGVIELIVGAGSDVPEEPELPEELELLLQPKQKIVQTIALVRVSRKRFFINKGRQALGDYTPNISDSFGLL